MYAELATREGLIPRFLPSTEDDARRNSQIMRLRTYQAQLTLPASLARVRAARPEIERIGGRVELMPTATAGLTTVIVRLPEGYQPEQFLPGLPFYPM